MPINELARIIAARADDILDDSSYVVKSIEICDNENNDNHLDEVMNYNFRGRRETITGGLNPVIEAEDAEQEAISED